ncbi:glycosyl hydrolase [Paucibacter sp. KBW04]|uniref:WD40/YVTN/BNR-like repeat-containing protein n=1 Tax=Paucibacter sp. KBW04 TaxID=2153361 RepID=UPI000F571EC4|nr:glycosyl hydrolase [Paucibacter sp. KBW04]RQO63541.1 glycosyl hydrolase [Paucibacter sp. KBW04]
MTQPKQSQGLSRRACLGLAAAALLPQAPAAGELALHRPLAARSTCLDVCQAGTRLVTVGERGHVLLSDDQGQHWRQARSVPTRTILTAVHAVDAQRLVAAGHGGLILSSSDAGENWRVAAGSATGPDTLLAIRLEADGVGLAVGGFGYALRTLDGGATWKRVELLSGEAGERHFNRIFVSTRGTWLIAAEGGQVLRSENRGEHWSAVVTPYQGSLWSGLALSEGTLLACGMRGNLLRSVDDGLTWRHIAMAAAGAGSLTGLTLLADHSPLLVGLDGSLLRGNVSGEQFKFQRLEDRPSLSGALALADGQVLLIGNGGPRLYHPI